MISLWSLVYQYTVCFRVGAVLFNLLLSNAHLITNTFHFNLNLTVKMIDNCTAQVEESNIAREENNGTIPCVLQNSVRRMHSHTHGCCCELPI